MNFQSRQSNSQFKCFQFMSIPNHSKRKTKQIDEKLRLDVLVAHAHNFV